MERADPLDFDWPLFGLQEDVRPALRAAAAAGEPAALATIYAVDGGAPRGLGAQMILTPRALAGFLSGGCIEADVAVHGREVLSTGAAQHLIYGEGGPSDIRLPCGSRLDVLVERVTAGDPAATRLLRLEEERRPALWLSDGARRACLAEGEGAPEGLEGALRAARTSSELGGAARAPFGLFRRHLPRTRLLILGSEPIALALSNLAQAMGLEVVMIRPKGPEAPPGGRVAYRRGGAREEILRLAPDPFTAVAVLSHEGELEEEALIAALPSPAGYVGVLGSRQRIPARRRRLAEAGVDADSIARLRAPIGLPIGGKSPFEIALAILAEITQTLSGGARRRSAADPS